MAGSFVVNGFGDDDVADEGDENDEVFLTMAIIGIFFAIIHNFVEQGPRPAPDRPTTHSSARFKAGHISIFPTRAVPAA